MVCCVEYARTEADKISRVDPLLCPACSLHVNAEVPVGKSLVALTFADLEVGERFRGPLVRLGLVPTPVADYEQY